MLTDTVHSQFTKSEILSEDALMILLLVADTPEYHKEYYLWTSVVYVITRDDKMSRSMELMYLLLPIIGAFILLFLVCCFGR